ncbi:hypothetical protein [Rhizobium sp. SYY.PMSO]|uniref:hypothetical protein n=1 Tax=Rhizobium sp. SYY.PMSO TaxID=3382192 RepID=UPI0039900CFF
MADIRREGSVILAAGLAAGAAIVRRRAAGLFGSPPLVFLPLTKKLLGWQNRPNKNLHSRLASLGARGRWPRYSLSREKAARDLVKN